MGDVRYVSLLDFYHHLSQVSFLNAKDPRMTKTVCVFWKLPERHSGQREQLVHRGRNVHWGGCRWLMMATVQSPDVQGAFGEQLGRFWKGDMGTDSKGPSEDFCLSVDIGNSRRPLIQR